MVKPIKGQKVWVKRFYIGVNRFTTEQALVVDVNPDNLLPYKLRFDDGFTSRYMERELLEEKEPS